MESAAQIEQLIEASDHGDERAFDRLMGLVYDELRALAAWHLQHERPDHTLQPTALVHEVYLKLFGQRDLAWKNRSHFFHVAARQIRRVLVDHARARGRDKRLGGRLRVTLAEEAAVVIPDVDLLALDEALARLDAVSPEDRQVVELRFFAGLTEEEIAGLLGTTERTVRRRWQFARAWLFRELGEKGRGTDDR